MSKNITYQQFMLAKITRSAGSLDVVGEQKTDKGKEQEQQFSWEAGELIEWAEIF